jgi:IS66 Orf2 like protein
MIVVPAGVKVHLALGHTDMRKGLDGLATLIQEHLKKEPFSGHLFVFRGKNASLLKILFWDGTGHGCVACCAETRACGTAIFSLPYVPADKELSISRRVIRA